MQCELAYTALEEHEGALFIFEGTSHMSIFFFSYNLVLFILFVLQYEQRGVICRDAVNDCDVPETCTGDSSKVMMHLYKIII